MKNKKSIKNIECEIEYTKQKLQELEIERNIKMLEKESPMFVDCRDKWAVLRKVDEKDFTNKTVLLKLYGIHPISCIDGRLEVRISKKNYTKWNYFMR